MVSSVVTESVNIEFCRDTMMEIYPVIDLISEYSARKRMYNGYNGH